VTCWAPLPGSNLRISQVGFTLYSLTPHFAIHVQIIAARSAVVEGGVGLTLSIAFAEISKIDILRVAPAEMMKINAAVMKYQ
jgi:hypothetical protein